MNSETDAGAATVRKRTLTEISIDQSDFDRLMDEIDIDAISDEDAARLEAFEADLVNERDTKFDICGGIIQDWIAVGEKQIEEGKRISALGTTKLNKAKWLKLRLLGYLSTHNITKPIETLRYRFSRAGNGGKAPVNLTSDAENNPVELPERYRRVTYSPHLDNIREDLERLDEVSTILAANKQISLVTDSDSDMDELRAMYAKGFIDRVLAMSPEVIEELKVEKGDLESLLNGVASLGERGEHLRIR